MMMLANHSILKIGPKVIHPFSAKNVNLCSYSLHLGDLFLNEAGKREYGEVEVKPGEFVVGTTTENITMPIFLSGMLVEAGDVNREGAAPNITAGFIEPGHKGNIRIGFHNPSQAPLILKKGQGDVVKLLLFQLSEKAKVNYEEFRNPRLTPSNRQKQPTWVKK